MTEFAGSGLQLAVRHPENALDTIVVANADLDMGLAREARVFIGGFTFGEDTLYGIE